MNGNISCRGKKQRSENEFVISLGILFVVMGSVLFGTWTGISAQAAGGTTVSPVIPIKISKQADKVSSQLKSVSVNPNGAQKSLVKPGAGEILPTSWLHVLNVEEGELVLVAGRSHVLRFSRQVARVAVSDPKILDFLMLSPTEVLLNAKLHGAVNLIVWDVENQVSNVDVNVVNDPTLLKKLLGKIDPKGAFEVYPSKDVFVVEGETSTVLKSQEIADAANAFAEGSISLTRVKNTKQILLQIRFIQVDLAQNFDFGIDLEHSDVINEHLWIHRFQPGGTNATTSGSSSMTLTNKERSVQHDIFDLNDDDLWQFHVFGAMDTHLSGYVKAIEEKGVGKTIARPNLIVKDGEEASFLVGGEAAVVVSTSNDIEVQFKEFGTRLNFKAEVLYDEKIRLTVEPEVSALDFANGVTVNDIVIPSFTSTKVNTVVEMAEYETLMIGGLLRQQMTTTETGVPFLRRVPVVGKFFQSTNRDWQETELLVLITPNFVNPEKAPLLEKDPGNDILSMATIFEKSRIFDEHALAINKYLKDQERYSDKIVSEDQSVKDVKGLKSEEASKKLKPTSSLKELEEALKAISKKREGIQPKKNESLEFKKDSYKRESQDVQSDSEKNKGYVFYRSKKDTTTSSK